MSAPRILHYPGSKWSMADWIISNMPEHTTYLEPFFGSGAVFFNKPRSPLETINDIDGDVVNLFRVIRERPDELAHMIRWTPYSREEYYASYEPVIDGLERARRFLTRCWMGQGPTLCARTGWRSVISASDPQPTEQWNDVPRRITAHAERLQGVQIEQQDAIELIKRYNRQEVMIYADPPYVLSTRSGKIYHHEMGEDGHTDLLNALDNHSGPVILSGYAHPLYDERLHHWKRISQSALAQRGKVTEEVLWINPIAAGKIGQQVMMF